MFLGKFRKHIEEIRRKHPKLDVNIEMPSDSFEYFSVAILDGYLHAKRIISTSDLDSYAGDAEDLLIIVLNQLVREIEKDYKEARNE